MRYWYQQPVTALSKYVRTILVMEGFAAPAQNQSALFTQGMPALCCLINKDPLNDFDFVQLTLYGRSTAAEAWDIGEHTTVIACFFVPFALPSLFNIPAASLAKEAIDLSHWDPHQTNALKIQLSHAAGTTQQLNVIENLLTRQLQQYEKECMIIQYSTDKMMYSPEPDIITIVLKELNITERTFQRMFKKYVGITPVQFRRICQFQQSFAQLRSGQFEDMTSVAFDNGFADQSHFIRSFKEFTDTTPHKYIRFGLNQK